MLKFNTELQKRANSTILTNKCKQ